MTKKIKTNLKRCPILTVTKKNYKYNGDKLIQEETVVEFNDCYRSFCMAWDNENCTCKIYPDFEVVDVEEDETDD